MTKGILVAADERMEWLLPWWWARYSAHNNWPVAFVDLGMSHFGKTFCKEKGLLLSLELDKTFHPHPLYAEKWKAISTTVFIENRKRWLQKPFAFLLTPFEQTLWVDLDCEVLASLSPLFALEGDLWLAEETEAALTKEREAQIIHEDEMLYNSGVVLYSSQSPLIQKLVPFVLEKGEQFWSDQHALSRLIYQEKATIGTLPEHYNWRMAQGLNLHAVIVHWVGSWGKEYIRQYGGIGDELAKLPSVL